MISNISRSRTVQESVTGDVTDENDVIMPYGIYRLRPERIRVDYRRDDDEAWQFDGLTIIGPRVLKRRLGDPLYAKFTDFGLKPPEWAREAATELTPKD